jgi:hypothetical protein
VEAYQGEAPVIDGYSSIPGYGGYLIKVRGDYINISGIEVRNSAYGGIYVSGEYDVVDNMYVHHSMHAGIIISEGQYSIVQNCRVWRNSLVNENGKNGYGSTGDVRHNSQQHCLGKLG